jgi:putative cell wall-binding protein
MSTQKKCSTLLVGLLAALSALFVGSGTALANVAPATAAAVVTASETVQVTWAEPTGAIGYLVVPVTSVNGTTTELTALEVQKAAGQSGHLFENLSNGTSYAFRVRAVYSGGVSDFRSTNSVTPAGPPSQPTGVSITPGDGQLVVSWSPVVNNGSPLQGYTVALLLGNTVSQTVTVSATSTTFTNLVNETTYQVRITATNGVGSTASELQSGTPTVGVAPPTGVEAVGGIGSVNLLWIPPVQTGGEVIDSYTIEITAPAAATRSVAGSASTYSWTGLTAGTQYTFRIKTINALNAQSAWSVTVQATPTSAGGGGGGVGGGTPADSEAAAPAGRVGGADRFQTSSLISQRFFSPGVSVVYLATGSGFADALAGGPATQGDGPMLLVTKTAIPSSTAAELDRLNPGRIVVLGGESVVSAAVLEAARSYTTGSVTRIGGADRYATAVQLSAATFSPGVEVAFIATGSGFADALAAGPAALGDGPVLLATRDAIPSSTAAELDRLNPGRIVVLGGESVVSAAVLEAARSYTMGTVTRIGGADRYATAVQLSAATFARGVSTVFIATGADFADALSAGPVGAPVLLARATCVPRIVIDEINRLNPTTVTVLGGMSVLSTAVRNLTPCA